jgi:hypothetical protein
VFAIHMIWFEGKFMFYPVYYIFCFSLVFSSYSPKSSPVILAFIYLIMLITVLG